MPSIYRGAIWVVAAPVVIYTGFIMLGITPFIQRHVLYAHKVYQWWQDSDQPQHWGFALTSFHLDTEDGEKIHAWHILPLPIYRQHELALEAQPTGHCDNVLEAESFRILKEDPNAKLIVYLHGNAGHLPSVVRAPSFHIYTATSDYHVIAIDYRGFGTSSGSPSEDGLVLDASAAVNFAIEKAGVPPHRIVVVGHSLGSAVAAGVAERYARVHGTDFAGVIMVAGFSSLPNMLSGYSIAGWVPILRPVRNYPRILHFILSFIKDHWESAKRLRNIVNIVRRTNSEEMGHARNGQPRRHLRLSLIHAADDRDIPCHEDDRTFATVVEPLIAKQAGDVVPAEQIKTLKEARTRHIGDNAFVSEWREDDVTIRQERFPHGGHNDMVLFPPVLLEIMRSFEEAEERYRS
ncbi:abhydrolase domain-containing protein [Ophiostoma piceae UAMH 11346]|uniref:Abhydrolase domain-containing protein n=1 Tax=Ophiostoma piceae (strain UAMH 11346) TaxID=1262450 RepID=S3CDR8_OPHP1|nr:abhydrolase domain-containing protein [Ophiostoma piceae UAMH 11346]